MAKTGWPRMSGTGPALAGVAASQTASTPSGWRCASETLHNQHGVKSSCDTPSTRVGGVPRLTALMMAPGCSL